MGRVGCVLVLALVAACALVAAAEMKLTLDAQFEAFKVRFGKEYESREAEARAKAAFADNMKRLPELRASNPHATFGVTKFSDVPADAFANRAYPGLLPRDKPAPRAVPELQEASVKALPAIVDWRTKGVIPPIINEGDCGGANPFILAAAMVSSVNAIVNGKLVPCSAQELVSCDTNDGGCCGGNFDTMFQWLLQNRGGALATEASYPYNASASDPAPACQTTGLVTCATVTGYTTLPQTDAAMQAAVAVAPIVSALDGQQTAFQMYTGGVITTCTKKPLVDHAVGIVGYNTDTETPYWIISNSWGADWGLDGFAYVAMGGKYPNECGINADPTSVKVKKV